MQSINPIKIRCGLANEIGINFLKDKFFWPVAKAIALSVTVDAHLLQKNFSVVFSSKTAVYFFYENIFQKNKTFFLNCCSIYCVGNKTKEYFDKLFSSYNIKIPVYFSEKMGIQNLTNEHNLTQKKEPLLIMTGLVGKTKNFIEQNFCAKNVAVMALYKLESYETNFLTHLFSKNSNSNQNNQYIFECYSGQIFEYTVQFLLKYFECSSAMDLPANITLQPIGRSAQEKEKILYEK